MDSFSRALTGLLVICGIIAVAVGVWWLLFTVSPGGREANELRRVSAFWAIGSGVGAMAMACVVGLLNEAVWYLRRITEAVERR